MFGLLTLLTLLAFRIALRGQFLYSSFRKVGPTAFMSTMWRCKEFTSTLAFAGAISFDLWIVFMDREIRIWSEENIRQLETTWKPRKRVFFHQRIYLYFPSVCSWEVVQSGLKFEIGRPAAHPGVAESAGRPAGSSGWIGRPAALRGWIGRPAALCGWIGRPAALRGWIGRPAALCGWIGRPAALRGWIGRPAALCGWIGRPAALRGWIGRPAALCGWIGRPAALRGWIGRPAALCGWIGRPAALRGWIGRPAALCGWIGRPAALRGWIGQRVLRNLDMLTLAEFEVLDHIVQKITWPV